MPDERDRAAPDAVTQPAFASTEPGGTATASQDTIVPRARNTEPIHLPAPGYDLGALIGRGGMGEVVTARDRRIGRDVAIKRMRGEQPTDADVNRFLREARIQARLDHPAIVPVHELGMGADNLPYFTMKRLAGTTLAQRLTEDVPVQRLLRAFSDVCSAIEFAHERGVVHRDLKPANIMLGDYGETYIIDWGIARVLAEARVGRLDIDTLSDDNATQSIFGTPGYMAPEQIRGDDITAAADVYALGAILFEILAREPLHERGQGAIASTLGWPQHSPAKRAPARDIPPELDAACFSALAAGPRDRPTARELGEKITKYLDGDRDLEQRKALAAELLAEARTLLASDDPEQRARAVRLAGRSLAFDPESAGAMHLVTSLIVEPPAKQPAELRAALDADEERGTSRRNRATVASLIAIMSIALLVPFTHVRSWTSLGLATGTFVVATAWLVIGGRRKPIDLVRTLGVTAMISIAFTRVLGSFILTPVLMTGSMLALTANVRVRKRPLIAFAWLALVIAAPLVLEAIGVFRTTLTMSDIDIRIQSPLFVGQGSTDGIVLLVANTLLLVAMAGYALRVNREIADARTELKIQAWHLGQLLPEGK